MDKETTEKLTDVLRQIDRPEGLQKFVDDLDEIVEIADFVQFPDRHLVGNGFEKNWKISLNSFRSSSLSETIRTSCTSLLPHWIGVLLISKAMKEAMSLLFSEWAIATLL